MIWSCQPRRGKSIKVTQLYLVKRVSNQENIHRHRLLSAALLHHQDLDHPNEDVQEVELERDTLVDRVLLDDARLGHPRVIQDLLDIVESEATKDSETTVQPQALSQGEGTSRGRRDDEGRKTGDSDDGSTGEKGTADVQVLLLLGSGTNEGDGAHHGNGIETRAGNQSARGEGEERRDESGLGSIEGGPECVLGNVTIRIDVSLCINSMDEKSICQYFITYLSGSIALVPIMVPKLRAKPPIATAHGFVTIMR